MDFLSGYKTYIGIIIAALPAVAGIFHWNLGDLTGLQDQLVTLIGAAIAIFGRFTAKPSA